MFDLIGGLPVHALVVHAVVVLLPLAVLGTVLIAAVPKWRRPYGFLVLAVSVVAAALIPVATESGEALAHHVGPPGEHAELGDSLIWFAIPLVVLVAGLVYVDRRGASLNKFVPTGVAVLAVIAAVAAGVQVFRVGDSGARAVWSDQVSSSQSSGGSSDGDGGGK